MEPETYTSLVGILRHAAETHEGRPAVKLGLRPIRLEMLDFEGIPNELAYKIVPRGKGGQAVIFDGVSERISGYLFKSGAETAEVSDRLSVDYFQLFQRLSKELEQVVAMPWVRGTDRIWEMVQRHMRLILDNEHCRVAIHEPVSAEEDRWIKFGYHPSVQATKVGDPLKGGDPAGRTIRGMAAGSERIVFVDIGKPETFVDVDLEASPTREADLEHSVGGLGMGFIKVGRFVIQLHTRTRISDLTPETKSSAGDPPPLLSSQAEKRKAQLLCLDVYFRNLKKVMREIHRREDTPEASAMSDQHLWESLLGRSWLSQLIAKFTGGLLGLTRFPLSRSRYSDGNKVIPAGILRIEDPASRIPVELQPHLHKLLGRLAVEAWSSISSQGEPEGYGPEFVARNFMRVGTQMLVYDQASQRFVGFQAMLRKTTTGENPIVYRAIEAAMINKLADQMGITTDLARRYLQGELTMEGHPIIVVTRTANPRAIGPLVTRLADAWPHPVVITMAMRAAWAEKNISDPFGTALNIDDKSISWAAVKRDVLEAARNITLEEVEAQIPEVMMRIGNFPDRHLPHAAWSLRDFAINQTQKDVLADFADHFSPGHETALYGAFVRGVYAEDSGLIVDPDKVQWHNDPYVNTMCCLIRYGEAPGNVFNVFSIYHTGVERKVLLDQMAKRKAAQRNRLGIIFPILSSLLRMRSGSGDYTAAERKRLGMGRDQKEPEAGEDQPS